MNFENRFRGATVSRRFVVGIALAAASLREAWAATTIGVTARSGEPLHCHTYWRVDAQGKEWPVTIQYTARPANGSVHTEVSVQPKALKNGTTKSVHVAQVVYQSKKGFVGQDSFSYRRVTADPTDPDSGKEYTIAVTVR